MTIIIRRKPTRQKLLYVIADLQRLMFKAKELRDTQAADTYLDEAINLCLDARRFDARRVDLTESTCQTSPCDD